jgi:hypothetical protein
MIFNELNSESRYASELNGEGNKRGWYPTDELQGVAIANHKIGGLHRISPPDRIPTNTGPSAKSGGQRNKRRDSQGFSAPAHKPVEF